MEIFFQHAKALKVGEIFDIRKFGLTAFRLTVQPVLQKEVWVLNPGFKGSLGPTAIFQVYTMRAVEPDW